MDDAKMEEREQRIESLGWLTESVVMPKKQRLIEGVGASSAVELRAQLYKSQEDSKRAQDGDDQRARKRPVGKGGDLFTQKNAGVEDRAHRDKLQLKAAESGTDVYAALERKAKLYEKLARGEVPDEEEKEKYSVDFFRKGTLEEEKDEMDREARGEVGADNDKTIGSFQESADGLVPGRGLSSEHKQLIREVNLETKQARGQAEILKQRRQSQAEKNREKLRQAFLKKQAEKMQAAKQKKKTAGQEKGTNGS